MPHPSPIQSKITHEMLGDAIMILEFLNNFGELFQLSGDFPNGFNLALLENALFSKSPDSALCNLLLFFLDSVFKCFDEEHFENEVEEDEINDEEILDAKENSDDEEVGLEQLYNVPNKVKKTATRYIFILAYLVKNYILKIYLTFNIHLKNTVEQNPYEKFLHIYKLEILRIYT